MNIAQLFHKLRIVSNIEIVVPFLPEMLSPTQAKTGLEWATGGDSVIMQLNDLGEP